MYYFFSPIKYFFLTIGNSVFVEHLLRKQLINLKKKKLTFIEQLSRDEMKESCIIAFCIVGIGNVLYCTSAYPEATPPIGKIRGSVSTSRLGKKIYSFRGVRYAEPPTERRRFQVNFSYFFPPSIIILLILERYQAHGHSSNLSSTFNCMETKGTSRVFFLQTNIYRVERSFGWE